VKPSKQLIIARESSVFVDDLLSKNKTAGSQLNRLAGGLRFPGVMLNLERTMEKWSRY
jgi:hypothetical protein